MFCLKEPDQHKLIFGSLVTIELTVFFLFRNHFRVHSLSYWLNRFRDFSNFTIFIVGLIKIKPGITFKGNDSDKNGNALHKEKPFYFPSKK